MRCSICTMTTAGSGRSRPLSRAALGGALALMTLSASPLAQAQAPAQDLPPIFQLPSGGAPEGNAAPGRFEGAPPAAPDQGGTRVVGGSPTTHQAWPSLVIVRYRAQGNGFDCGGTVIAPDWVLTAGHCAGGAAAGYSVTEGTDNPKRNPGRDIGVSEVIRHESYNANPPHNDVALLHLRSSAQSPPQLLVSGAVRGQLESAGAASLVAGFGYTRPQPVQGEHIGPGSDQLLQVQLPIVDRATCTRILGKFYDSAARFIDEATVCAGDTAGGKDSCNGDSGGPIAINAAGGRQVQIGVVSWGPGCGQRDTVGIYASVGHFEGWIKQRVPGATFYASPGSAPAQPSQPAVTIASVEAAAAALGSRAGIQVEIVEGNRARVGSIVHFHVNSPIAGQLLVYNIDLASGSAYQVFPNRFPGGSRVQIAAGASVTVPNPSTDRFDIRVQEPAGQNRLYAFVLPPNIKMDDIADRGLDMNNLADPEAIFKEIADRALRGLEVVAAGRADRGAAVFQYEIVR
ncbi:MAG TPA: trypsin-like serine protease [Xanthobacteraceae bacterium]